MNKEQLVAKCSELFDVHPRDLMGRYRYAFLIPAKFAMYAALRQRGWSANRIGRELDRDRKTVTHGLARAAYLMRRDPDYAEKVHQLSESIDAAPWVPSPADVFNFVCAAAGEHPNLVRKTLSLMDSSNMIGCIAARVALDAGMDVAPLSKTLGQAHQPTRDMAEKFDWRWADHDAAADLYDRALAQFPKKAVAIEDCACEDASLIAEEKRNAYQ